MRKLDLTRQLTTGAMVSALNILCLYAASVLPTGRLACMFMSSVFIYALCCERAYLMAFVSFLVTAAIGFFMLPQRWPAAAYALLLGHYGIFRTWLDTAMGDGIMRFISKLIYCNAFFALGIWLLRTVFDTDVTELVPALPLWVLIAILEAAFAAFDALYLTASKLYDNNVRKFILPRR